MSYESPITTIYEEIQSQIEDGMLKAVQNVGFNVNKIELQRALMYDRKQYSQGFEDGKKYAEQEMKEKEKKRLPFLWFDKRTQLENCFYKWCEENEARTSPFNVISFLAGKDMLNIDKVIDYLEEH